MPFCENCGAEYKGDIHFCPMCRHPISEQATRTAIVKKEDSGDTSIIGDQLKNTRNFIEVFFGVGLLTVIFFLINEDINPLTSTAVIILGLFIVQSRNFSSTPNKNKLNTLRNVFYIFVATACLGLIYAILMWGFYPFFILELIYFLILFHLMNQYIMNAQIIVRFQVK